MLTGTRVRVGEVAPQADWGHGGATQFELLERPPESAFQNTRGDDKTKLSQQLGGEVAQSLDHSSFSIVGIDPPKGVINNCNIYALSASGGLVSQVEDNITINGESPYTNMALKADGLHLFNWDGADVLVDFKTGNILQQTQVK